MWVKLDGTDRRYYWDFFEHVNYSPTDWACELVSARCDGTFDNHGCDPVRLELESGQYTITFETLEPDFALDRIQLRLDNQ